jgi:hypothetical protein
MNVSGEGEEPTNDKSYQYLTTDDVLKMTDDTQIDITNEEGHKKNSMSRSFVDPTAASIEDKILQLEKQKPKPVDFGRDYGEDKIFPSDNVDISAPPITAG